MNVTQEFIADYVFAISDMPTIASQDWEEVDALCFKSGALLNPSCSSSTLLDNTQRFYIDLDLINKLDYGICIGWILIIATIRNVQEESRKNKYGGATAGLTITPFPIKEKKANDSVKTETMGEKHELRTMPIEPLYSCL